MRLLKKPVSLLLSLIMILSVFTIIPATSASAESAQIFVRKWVEAENVTGDYFSFTDLYSNFIICRVNPDFDETNFNVDDTSNVYNRTGDISLGNYNEIRLNDWNDGYGHLNFYTATNGPAQGDGKIYLSTNGDNINFNTDGVKWYAYTWETFTADSVDAVAPTYDKTAEKPYINGVKQHYEAGERKFVDTDGNQNFKQVSDNELAVPYFEFEKISDNSYKLTKCNAQDADIVVPDTIPVSYPDNLFWGKNITVIGGGAFAGNTNLESIEIGDNVNLIGSDMIGNSYDAGDMLGAFEGCSSLETVTIGSAFNNAAEHCFDGCSSLQEFTTTTHSSGENDSYWGLADIADDNDDQALTIRCWHNSSVASFFARTSYDNIDLEYLGGDTQVHVFSPGTALWTWSGTGYGVTAELRLTCSVCGYRHYITVNNNELEQIPVDPENYDCTVTATGYYKATVEYDGHTYSDDDNKSHTCTIQSKQHTPVTTGEYANLYEYDSSTGYIAKVSECSVCGKGYTGSWIPATLHQANNATCTKAGNYEYCTDNGGNYYRFLRAEGYTRLYTKVDGENDVIIPIDPDAHALYAHPANDPTLSTDGNIAYWNCTKCGKYFSDANAQNEIAQGSWVLPKTAVAYVADDYYTESFYEAVQYATAQNGATIELLKDATLNYDSHVAATNYPTFKVKLNGNTLGVTTNYPGIYTVNTSVPDSYGVTTYTLTHNHSYDVTWSETPVKVGDNWEAVATFTCKYCGDAHNITSIREDSAVLKTSADCTNEGYKNTSFYAQYGDKNVSTNIKWDIVAALGHILTEHPANDPTVSQDGNTAYWSCSRCHKYFSDANAKTEIAENSWVIEKTAVAHIADELYTESFYEAVQYATAHNGATIDLLKDTTLIYPDHRAVVDNPTFKVRLNDHTLTVETPEADEPNVNTVSTTGPDDDGVTTYTLTHKHRWKAEWNDLNPVDHETYWDVDVDCTCDYCGETKKIKATAQHDSSYTEIVDATCTKGGYKKSNFSAQLNNTVVNNSITWGVVNALGHNLTEHPAHEPTLSDDGNSAYWSCSRCGKFFSDAEAHNEIRQNSWILEKTAVAYFSRGENQDFWFGDIKSAVEASAAYGNIPFLLLKNAEFEWDEKLIADGITSFRVRLNRHILGITAPEGYRVNESTADGITTYSLEALPYTMYLAEDGTDKKAYDATPITSDFTVLTDGWYSVDGNVIINHDLMIQDDVKIILTDGSVLSINDGIRLNDDQGPETAGTITFYRQSGDYQGKLNAISITADDFTLVGGELNIAESVTAHNDANISGGDLTVLTQNNFEHNALSAGGNVNISGGTVILQGDSGIVATGSTDSAVNITGGDITLYGKYTGVRSYHVNITGGDLTAVQEWEYSNAAIVGLTDITLSWSNNGDSIYAESYSRDVTLLKPFIDDDGEIYLPGIVSKNKIADKALYPGPHEHTYTAHFNWDGYECPNADLTCTQCDAPAVTVDATVTSSITTEATPYAEGVRTYTATAVYNGKTFTDTKEETIPKTSYYTKHSLTLAGDIGVNFYIDYLNADDVAAGKVRVDFVCNGKNYSVTVGTDTTEVEGRQLYKATCYVSAAEMKDDITATLYIDNVETCIDHYTVRQYADVILNGNFDQKDKDVVGAMLNYGAMAQKQFDHKTDDLANAGVTGYDLAELTDAEIESLGNALPNSADTADALSAYGVKYYGCSLLLRSKTTLRFYFEKTDATKFDAANFKIDGNTVEVNNYGDGSRYVYIEVTNIAAPDLAATHKVAVGNVEIGNVSPLNYAKDVLSDADASADLKNVMTALYRFYEAADKRF